MKPNYITPLTNGRKVRKPDSRRRLLQSPHGPAGAVIPWCPRNEVGAYLAVGRPTNRQPVPDVAPGSTRRTVSRAGLREPAGRGNAERFETLATCHPHTGAHEPVDARSLTKGT